MDQTFGNMFEMLCRGINGEPTGMGRTKDDTDSHAQIPETPPGIPQTARIKNRTRTWRTDEVQSDDLTIPQRNRIQTAIRNMVANKVDIPPGEVWIELQQGSLQVTMDVGTTGSG